MLLITFTVNLAYEDAAVGKQAADYVADQVTEFLLDKLDAEVCALRNVASKEVEYPDFSTRDDPTDADIEDWQAIARAELGLA